MSRVLLTVVLPLFLPTLLYAFWRLTFGRVGFARSARGWWGLPWLWLAGAGAVLMAIVFVSFVQLGGSASGVYVAPHLEDGRVVPGHVVPAAPVPR